MNTRLVFNAIIVASMFIFFSCSDCSTKDQECCSKEEKAQTEVKETTAKDDVISQEEQKSLTPDDVIASLKKGNENYVNNQLTERDHKDHILKTSEGQYPQAIVLACVDSRVPVELLFDQGIGDIFVARVAGNFVNEDILGSMEYACKVAGSKVVMVLGHEYCGAVKSAVKQVKMGNITAMLSKIQPAIDNLEYEGEKSCKNKEYMHKVCESNVQNNINEIRLQSPILKEMEEKGEIKIVGGIYDLDNGTVTFLD